jgi:transmembrane 9 superfamily protein 2/4
MHPRTILLCYLTELSAFYLPGVAPREYKVGEKVELKVNKLTSTQTHLPYDYYSHKFCKPSDGVRTTAENLGEFLSGDRIENSPYALFMRHDEYCLVLCQVKLSVRQVAQFKRTIDESYHHNWILDNIPAASVVDTETFVTTSYSRGFPVGHYDHVAGKHYLYNHANIVVEYHEVVPDGNRIVGFYVEPFSIDHKFLGDVTWNGKDIAPEVQTCSKAEPMDLSKAKGHELALSKSTKVVYTYDIAWKPSNIKWASRWDIYLSMDNAVPKKVHWFSIVNSLMIVFCLSVMIAMILIRNLRRDISQYNQVPLDEETNSGALTTEETGWKLVHQDVFRPPRNLSILLCVFVGSGIQVLIMALTTIAFAAVGFISPASRGSLMFVMLLLFVLMGSFAGYHCARLYKTFKGQRWQRATLSTALLFPGSSFVIFICLDIALRSYEGSTGAVPMSTLLTLLILWFGISVPLVFFGAHLGFRKEPFEFPAAFSKIPRPIPRAPWYLSITFTVTIGGILPFGACFVELFFILSSMWMDQYYYVFGFTFLVFCILLITCAEITIVLLYFQLLAEDYQWWWRAFLTSGSTAAYVFLYSSFYFSKLKSNLPITYFLYFGYMGIISLGIFLLTGTVGFYAALAFNVVIFSSIKVD